MTGTPLPGPGIDLEVCLGIGSIQPGGVWDSGLWDYNTWQETDTTLGNWTDVTCQVAGDIGLGAGTSPDGVVTRWESATCSFDLVGALFDPRSGPYAALLGPGLPVRVRWRVTGDPDWLVAFVGATDDEGFSYDPKTAVAHIAATDGTRIFAAFDAVEQAPVGSGETAAQRVTRIADLVGWPANLRDIAPGGVALQPTTLAQAAWTMLLAVADTDLALLWLSRDGKLTYRPQGKVQPQRKLSAIVGCHVDPPAGVTAITPLNILDQQPTITRNIVSVSRQSGDDNQNPYTVTKRDEASVSRFLAHSYQRTDLLHLSDSWTDAVASAILMTSAWPSSAPAAIELSSRADAAATVLLLGLEPSLSVQVTDGINTWLCEPAGWDVKVNRREVTGTVELLDVTQWYGSAWDEDGWDIGVWGW
jgi:hypothetical protein